MDRTGRIEKQEWRVIHSLRNSGGSYAKTSRSQSKPCAGPAVTSVDEIASTGRIANSFFKRFFYPHRHRWGVPAGPAIASAPTMSIFDQKRSRLTTKKPQLILSRRFLVVQLLRNLFRLLTFVCKTSFRISADRRINFVLCASRSAVAMHG